MDEAGAAWILIFIGGVMLAWGWYKQERQRNQDQPAKTQPTDPPAIVFTIEHIPPRRRRSVEPLDLSTIEWPQPLTAIELRRLAIAQRPDGPVFGIVYRSAAGEQTARIVMPTVLDDELFQAWCYRREDTRTFRYDRCVLFYDPRTGEILDDFEAALRTGESVRTDIMAIRSKRDKKPRRLK